MDICMKTDRFHHYPGSTIYQRELEDCGNIFFQNIYYYDYISTLTFVDKNSYWICEAMGNHVAKLNTTKLHNNDEYYKKFDTPKTKITLGN